MNNALPKSQTMEGWTQLHGEHYYRKLTIYPRPIFESLNLKTLKLYGCSEGGPIATMRDDSKVILVKDPELVSNIDVYSSSGVLLASFKPIFFKNIVTMGWDNQERMIFILADGTVMLYSVLGIFIQKFILEGECKEYGIIDAFIWERGFVVLTQNYQFYSISDLDSHLSSLSEQSKSLVNSFSAYPTRSRLPDLVKLKGPEFMELPHSWTVIKPHQSRSGEVELYVSTSQALFLVTKDKATDMSLQLGAVLRMSLSSNGKLLALFSKSGFVRVFKSDFTKELSQYETKSPNPPKQLTWCGSDAVLAYWELPDYSDLLLIGPEAKLIRYVYPVPVFTISEMDGLRILSTDGMEFLQRVPNVTSMIMKIGSMTPAALLVNAAEQFESRNPKADVNIREIKAQNQLVAAVEACVEAAGYEFDVALQKHLLMSAAYGKSFLDALSYDSNKFVNMTKLLRVLNAVRDKSIGIPLTSCQYQKLTPQRLVDRLTYRHRHFLASQISLHLNLRSEDGKYDVRSKIMGHWAKSMVVIARETDAALVAQICERLKSIPGVDFADIAREAKARRPDLASQLLEYEPQASKQVPLLLSMDRSERALCKAMQSGDVDLVDAVLKHLKDKNPKDLYVYLHRYPDACAIWVTLQMELNSPMLEQFYNEELKKEKDENRRHALAVRLAHVGICDANSAIKDEIKENHLSKASSAFTMAGDSFSAKSTGEELDLQKEQRSLETKLKAIFVGLSVNETVHKCIVLGQESIANDLKNRFKIPPKRFAWIKIKALGEIGQWDLLRRYAATSTGVGYGPFAEVCIKYNKKDEAMEYIKRIEEQGERALLYARANAWDEALATVAKMKEPQEILWKLKSACNNPQIQHAIQEIYRNSQ